MTGALLLDLDDPRACDPAVAGGKAALLAAARAEGLPVVDGVVVPRSASGAAFGAGVSALREPGGRGAARRHALQCSPDPALLDALVTRVMALGEPVIVRSSALVEDDGSWSGAFASMGDVEAHDLASALRSCWASSFSPDVLERREEMDTPVADLQLALLVQRHLDTDAAGTAEVQPDGSVRVVATAGSPAALMQGWDVGATFAVRGSDLVPLSGSAQVEHSAVAGAAALAVRAHHVVGATSIEWGASGGQVYLLQCRRSTPAAGPVVPASEPGEADPALAEPAVVRVARVLARYRGCTGFDLVLPWALGLPELPAPAPAPVPAASGTVAQRLSGDLAATAWGLPAAEAAAAATQVLAALRSGNIQDAVDRIGRCVPVDAAAAAALLAAVEQLPNAERSAALRWEPFLHDVARATGHPTDGTGIVPGIGAGAAAVLFDPWTAVVRTGEVMFLDRPLPGFSPLLWRASALVCRGGGAAAHLFEVASSLGVPTVVAEVDVTPGQLVSVDGAGLVWTA